MLNDDRDDGKLNYWIVNAYRMFQERFVVRLILSFTLVYNLLLTDIVKYIINAGRLFPYSFRVLA